MTRSMVMGWQPLLLIKKKWAVWGNLQISLQFPNFFNTELDKGCILNSHIVRYKTSCFKIGNLAQTQLAYFVFIIKFLITLQFFSEQPCMFRFLTRTCIVIQFFWTGSESEHKFVQLSLYNSSLAISLSTLFITFSLSGRIYVSLLLESWPACGGRGAC